MTIHQILPSLTYGDAIGNDVLAINSQLASMGYKTAIGAFDIDHRLADRATRFNPSSIQVDDIVIYHFSTGGKLSSIYGRLLCKKILRYHNITPAHFFKPYRPLLALRLDQGREQLRRLASCTDYSIPVSQYNAQELVDFEFNANKMSVLPVLINFEDYNIVPDKKVLEKIQGQNGTKILFVGRVSPNKKIEDAIKVFYYYKTFVDPQARLYLVGSAAASEKYYAKLCGFVVDLQLSDVYFTGHIPFEQILSYYRAADVFVCMSEHEGFCVPLLEAMYFNVPIVSYASSAIPETLGGSGVKLKEKDYIAASEAIRLLQTDPDHRRRILAGQQKRLGYFKNENMNILFKNTFKQILEKT